MLIAHLSDNNISQCLTEYKTILPECSIQWTAAQSQVRLAGNMQYWITLRALSILLWIRKPIYACDGHERSTAHKLVQAYSVYKLSAFRIFVSVCWFFNAHCSEEPHTHTLTQTPERINCKQTLTSSSLLTVFTESRLCDSTNALLFIGTNCPIDDVSIFDVMLLLLLLLLLPLLLLL